MFLPRCVSEEVLSEVVFAVIFWWLLTVTGICQVLICHLSACMCLILAYTIMTGVQKSHLSGVSGKPKPIRTKFGRRAMIRGRHRSGNVGCHRLSGGKLLGSDESCAAEYFVLYIPDTRQYTQCYFMARRSRPKASFHARLYLSFGGVWIDVFLNFWEPSPLKLKFLIYE